MATHPDLVAEQAYLDLAYQRLEAMREASRQTLDSALASGGGTPQALEERDAMVRNALRRLEQLDIGDRALCFGRIDMAPESPGDASAGDTFYVGRLAVADESLEPLVVDWRAPVAEPFYRATGRDPMGLTRRRHFATEGRKLLAIEDELFALPRSTRQSARHEVMPAPPAGNAGDEGIVGASASATLLAALERSRSTHMSDIVATVQREQDEIIRSPLPGVLVVQGGPGTGKTAVALHRAAYLLYTYRFPLERQGVLVVGPNQVFLRYIEQVLPSLGESGVALSTVGGLVPVKARATEPRQLSALKGDARMAGFLAKAVADRQRPLGSDVTVPFGSTILTLRVGDTARIVRAAKGRPGPHNARRRYVEGRLVQLLVGQLRRSRERLGRSGTEELVDEELAAQLRELEPVREALQRIWPRLTPEELVHDTFGARPLIALAGSGLLDASEQASLYRPRSRSLSEIPWTGADLALLDEGRSVLGPAGGDDDEPVTYGHIVVDEAQDLSAMQLRLIARRSLSGSMTVVGDMAQAMGARAPRDWDEVTIHLPARRAPRTVELSVNYRTPAEVMELASRVLAAAAPGLRPPRSVRRVGADPEIVRVAPSEIVPRAAAVAGGELANLASGTLAVVAPASLVADLSRAMRSLRLPVSEASVQGLGERITLASLEMVKGLEFDAVVAVEPALLTAQGGLRGLYVALSRPTRKLVVVHSLELPEALAAGRRSDVLAEGRLD